MDPSRSIVPTASVTLHAVATAADLCRLTNAAGVYYVQRHAGWAILRPRLSPPDSSHFKFRPSPWKWVRRALQRHAARRCRSSNVTVMEAAPDLELTTSEGEGVIHSSQTNALPVNGRYWASLMALIPGAVSSGTGTQNASDSQASREDNNFRFDGVGATGLNHRSSKNRRACNFRSNRLQSSRRAARSTARMWAAWPAGPVSIVSKSGSNEFHGSAYEYLRNVSSCQGVRLHRRSRRFG